MTELINDVFNSFYAKLRKEAALLHVQMLELNGSQPANCCPTNNDCNMESLKALESRVMEIVTGLEQRLENSFKQRFENIEKTIAALLESDSSDQEHEPVAPAPTPGMKVISPKHALPIPSKEVSPLPSPVASEDEELVAEEAEEEEAEEQVGEEEEVEEEKDEQVEEEGEGHSPTASAAEEEEAESETKEEEEEEEEAEEEESELTEFQFRGKTYYLDNENNVYGLDADGELIQEPVGVRDEKTGRIKFVVAV